MTPLTPLTPLPAQLITPESFRPYGQVIRASADGKSFDAEDAQLELSQGMPRFYIMRLQHRGRCFERITLYAVLGVTLRRDLADGSCTPCRR
jgi:hypothetical protein